MNDELNKFLNQSINTLNDTEEKEYIFNSNYAGRKINIRISLSVRQLRNINPKRNNG